MGRHQTGRGRRQSVVYFCTAAYIVTDDREVLRERLEAATGERIAALDAVESEPGKTLAPWPEIGRRVGREEGARDSMGRTPQEEKTVEPNRME